MVDRAAHASTRRVLVAAVLGPAGSGKTSFIAAMADVAGAYNGAAPATEAQQQQQGQARVIVPIDASDSTPV